MSTRTTKTGAAQAAPANDDPADDGETFDPGSSGPHPTLAHALLAAQRAVGRGAAKTGTAKVETRQGGSYSYRYVTGEDMVAHARACLHSAGLVWTLEAYRVELPEVDDKGQEIGLAIFSPTYVLEHPESGAVVGSPEGQPQPRRYTFPIPIGMTGAADKALAGARTYANSYALRDVLQIPRPDENEPDKRKSDEGVGSWRGRRRDADAPASSSSREGAGGKPDPRRIATDEMMLEWRTYQAARRAAGEEPTFTKVYRASMGKTWPGSDKATADEMLKFAVELRRLAKLDDEAAAADEEHTDTGEGEGFQLVPETGDDE